MLAPKAIRNQSADLTAITNKATKALYNRALSDVQANEIIDACNYEYMAKGGVLGGQVIKRK